MNIFDILKMHFDSTSISESEYLGFFTLYEGLVGTSLEILSSLRYLTENAAE